MGRKQRKTKENKACGSAYKQLCSTNFIMPYDNKRVVNKALLLLSTDWYSLYPQ